jgi:phospholipid/cholesterol/gamma-HCH transport system permease protein
MREILKTISTTLNELLYTIGLYVIMSVESIVLLVFNPPSWGLIRDQLYNIGLLSLPVVSITGLSTGMVLAAQSFFQLADKGLASATGIMVGKAMMTELGPVLTAFMVTGRIGSAMCAEIGTMKVTEQLDALRSMSVDPLSYLVSPRIIASTVMMPLLTLFSTLTGMLGGFIIASYFFDMAPVSYFGGMQIYITYFDFATGLVKAVVFGIFIGSICCFKGLTANGGAAGVGKATTNSVVIAYTCILIFNFLLTLGMNTVRVWIYHR